MSLNNPDNLQPTERLLVTEAPWSKYVISFRAELIRESDVGDLMQLINALGIRNKLRLPNGRIELTNTRMLPRTAVSALFARIQRIDPEAREGFE